MEDEGSMLIGGLLGFFLGCIGLLVAFFVLGQPKTKTGAIYGFVAAIVLSLCLGGTLGVLQVVLNNM